MSNEKDIALKKCIEILKNPWVQKWYDENLTTTPQKDTIKALEKGVIQEKLSVEEALSISLLVGFQWNVKFEGIP